MKAALGLVSLTLMLALVAGTTPAGAQPSPCPSLTPIVLGGETNLAFIDVNRNGVRDSGDCIVTGVGQETDFATTAQVGPSTAEGSLCFTAQQGAPPFVQGCNSAYGGSADLDPVSGMGTAREDSGPNDVNIRYSRQQPTPSVSPGPLAQGGTTGGAGFPVTITAAEVFNGDFPAGAGFLCEEGGLAIRATVYGVRGIARFGIRSIGGVNHACSPLPFETVGEGMQIFPLCIPVGSGPTAQGGLQGGMTFVQFPLAGLQACGASGAPSANEWGLLGLASALLVCGTWILRRRTAFGAALPLA